MSNHPDPVLRLLWRHDADEPPSPRRGRKQRLSVDDVVDAAIRIADRDGLPGLSMRLLATDLGLGAMSLYTYVPGRDELLALMVDRALGRRQLPTMPDDLPGRMALIARVQYELCQEHPWLLEISGLRAWVGPGASDLYEWQVSGIDGVGLDDIEMDQTVALLTGFAGSVVRAQQRMRQDERASGLTQAEWWAANADELDVLMAGREYPVAGRVGAAAGEAYQAATDPAREMEFGLARIIDGLIAYIEGKPGGMADALSDVAGSRGGHPTLLLLNGLPASGKSATAQAWAAQRPGTLVLDIDLVRTLVSGDDAAAQARALAHAMAESHLLSGHDVVVPQLTARIGNLVPFEEIATRTRAALVHVLLDADSETLRRRITADDAPHRDGLDEEQVAQYSAGLRDVARTRHVTRIDTGRLTTDEVVTELERLSG